MVKKLLAPMVALAIVCVGGSVLLSLADAQLIRASEREEARVQKIREKHAKKVRAGGRIVFLPESNSCWVLFEAESFEPGKISCGMAQEVSLMTDRPVELLR